MNQCALNDRHVHAVFYINRQFCIERKKKTGLLVEHIAVTSKLVLCRSREIGRRKYSERSV